MRDSEGMEGTRIWLNTNGERVVTKKKYKSKAKDSEGLFESEERRLLLGLMGAGVGVQVVLNGVLKPLGLIDRKRYSQQALEASALEGDAVTRPAIELQLEGVVRGEISGGETTIKNLVGVLEGQGGSAIAAAARPGRWAVPWVGGWERLCTSETDAAFVGGPSKAVYAGKSQSSVRHFICAPFSRGV